MNNIAPCVFKKFLPPVEMTNSRQSCLAATVIPTEWRDQLTNLSTYFTRLGFSAAKASQEEERVALFLRGVGVCAAGTGRRVW